MTLHTPSARPDRPLFRCAWGETAFLHFEVDPEPLRALVPRDLDLYEGRAFISVVAITIRPLGTAQSFLNVRTYVKGGISFLSGWASNPLGAWLIPRVVGLPYRPARMTFDTSLTEFHVTAAATGGVFEFRAVIDPRQTYREPDPGSLDEFLLERYLAYSRLGRRRLAFRVRHEPWRIVRMEPEFQETGLLETSGGWFQRARLVRSHHSPGFDSVGMGRLVRARA